MRPRLALDGFANARDLGGLAREDGSLTPTGVFLRTEVPDLLDASGWDALRSQGVRAIVDLRRAEEVTGSVPADFSRVHVDLDGDERHFWDPIEADGRWGTPLYYGSHMRELPHRLVAALDAIAEAPEGAVLVHCGAGWDRTGLVASVLLKAQGVTEDAALEDYLASFENAESMEALHGRPSHVDERLGVLERFGHTPESAFRAMYRELDVEEWFEHAGVSERTRLAVRTWRGAAPAR